MKNRMIKFSDYLNEFLQDETARAEYLNAALEEFCVDHNKELFLIAIKNVINAGGGITEIAKKTQLSRQHLYRMLSPKGNPRFDNLGLLLNAIGLKLTVEPLAH